MLSTAAHFVAV